MSGFSSFHNLYRHGFARVAVGLPRVELADPHTNLDRILELAEQMHARKAVLGLFPELTLSGYSIDDLLHQDTLLDAVRDALDALVERSAELLPVLIVGAPLRIEQKLFNCAVAIHRGRVLGVVPKTYLPNYREYYEKRHFVPSHAAIADTTLIGRQEVPFGTDLLFAAEDLENFVIAVEICEDLWAPVPPSTWSTLAGATVVCNPSGSNTTVAKADYRRLLGSSQSGRSLSAYVYAGCGQGESTTDLAWDGHGMVHENANLLAESERFRRGSQLIVADVDLERLVADRLRLSSWNDTVSLERERVAAFRRIDFILDAPDGELPLEREVSRFPYVPADADERRERCAEVYSIQVQGLAQRLEATGIERVVIGVSGGLDSSQALLVAVRTMDYLGLPRENVLAYTMPGFATSESTRKSALDLMAALGTTGGEIDIRPSCEQMLRDIDHPFVDGEPVYDVTFENVQAGERTSHLFRLANRHGALVVGTGDLSELALGWATYGVGDHMSHYNVNASVPKTLIQHLIRYELHNIELNDDTTNVLRRVLDTEISPELVPASDEAPIQSTEETVGPFALQDFNLYYTTRYGFRPSRVAFLAHTAWADANRGSWPRHTPEASRVAYDLGTIKKWLAMFLDRFFRTSQFKRSAVPNGPKVGSGGSLSPRGDWRAPSDGNANAWLRELEENVPGE